MGIHVSITNDKQGMGINFKFKLGLKKKFHCPVRVVTTVTITDNQAVLGWGPGGGGAFKGA